MEHIPQIDIDTLMCMARHHAVKERPPKGTWWVVDNGEKIYESNNEQDAHDHCPTNAMIVGAESTYFYKTVS